MVRRRRSGHRSSSAGTNSMPDAPPRRSSSRSQSRSQSRSRSRPRSPQSRSRDRSRSRSRTSACSGHSTHSKDLPRRGERAEDDPAPEKGKKKKRRSSSGKEKSVGKKPRLVTADPQEAEMLQSKGRIVGRVVDMFSSIEIIIATGIARSPEDDDDLFTAKDNLLYGTYIELLKIIPTLHDLINKLGKESAAREIGGWIDAGRKDARNSDVSTIKGEILYWYKFDPPFSVARQDNGFHHVVCGRLLCPDILNWQDPKVKEKLRDRLVQIKAGDFPSFLWAEEHCDKSNLYAGFLQHPLLVRGYLCIFYGPAAAKKGTPGGHGHGNAQIHNITAPTFPAIVYIVILIHFALSSQTTFDAGGTPGKFP
ncbi:hypothetical protein C8J57DRAFT_1330817, partial [Mycena rebaudengoi]